MKRCNITLIIEWGEGAGIGKLEFSCSGSTHYAGARARPLVAPLQGKQRTLYTMTQALELLQGRK